MSFYRVRKEGDSTEEKLTVACSDIVSKLDDTLLSPGTGGTIQYKIKQLTPITNEARFKYDVFISYSHKDPQQAEALLQAFGEIDEMVRVFYDRSELTTGWLHKSICLFVLLLYVPSQQLWSWRDGQFT